MSRIDSIIDVAKGWLGTTEYGTYHQEIIDWYNWYRWSDAYKMTLDDPWCAAFIVACFGKAGCPDLVPCYASCDQMIAVFKQWNRWYPRTSYSPKRGDIIFYEWNGDTVSDHVGIVLQNSFGDLRVIEGNKSDTVDYRNINMNSANILGVGRPNYDGESGGNSTTWSSTTEDHPYDRLSYSDKRDIKSFPLLFLGSTGVYVKVLQLLLALKFDKELAIDGSFGQDTERVLKAYQTSKNLECDGYAGKDTWTSLIV